MNSACAAVSTSGTMTPSAPQSSARAIRSYSVPGTRTSGTTPSARGYGSYELSVGGVPIVVGSGWADREPWQPAFFASPFAQNVLAEKAGGTAGALGAAGEGSTHWMMREGLVSFLATWGERRRLVLCLPGRFWLVIDQVNGTGPWAGESLLHLDPACGFEI